LIIATAAIVRSGSARVRPFCRHSRYSALGLDRAAAKEAFAKFIESKTPTGNQIEFINVIIDHLTDQGYMDPGLLYASPFIDFSPKGVDGLFTADQVTAIFSILDGIRETAATAIA
jgi:type I restriction enzyme R subunit